jgi:hypothetical protein
VIAGATDVEVTDVVAARSVGDEPCRALTVAWVALVPSHDRAVAVEGVLMRSGLRSAVLHGGQAHHSGIAVG